VNRPGVVEAPPNPGRFIPQARHELHALEDAAVLLTVAKLP